MNTSRPLLLSPLRLLVALLVSVVAFASGVGVAEAQNGVAAINPDSAPAVGAAADIAPGHVGWNTGLFDDGVSGCCVAPSGLADDGARFVADSAGNTTLRAKGPQGWIDVSEHAAQRMTQRGISIDAVDNALTTQPFNSFHGGVWKVGYYDPGSRVFVGTVNGNATTVITTGPNYINNLKSAQP